MNNECYQSYLFFKNYLSPIKNRRRLIIKLIFQRLNFSMAEFAYAKTIYATFVQKDK